MRRALIILDAGGVLLTDLTEKLLQRVAGESERDLQIVEDAYRSDGLREQLWTGQISVDEFWTVLGLKIGFELQADYWNSVVLKIQRRDVDSHYVAQLLLQGDLAIATNHRSEWLRPILRRDDIDARLFKGVIISSEVGVMKPQSAFYEVLRLEVDGDYSRRIFVDDKEENLQPARDMGFDVLLAEDQSWQNRLIMWLSSEEDKTILS